MADYENQPIILHINFIIEPEHWSIQFRVKSDTVRYKRLENEKKSFSEKSV